MEVQLDYADKQLRELRHKLDNAGTVFLGDNTEFLKLKKESDVSLMGKISHLVLSTTSGAQEEWRFSHFM